MPHLRRFAELGNGLENCFDTFWMYVRAIHVYGAGLTFAALLTFYVQTWDEYHTKTLTLGLVSGPVEGIVILIFVYAFTAVKGGGSFWQQSALATLGVPHYSFIPESVYQLAFNEWWMFQGGAVLVLNTVQS
jgi:ethanolaminephosphotransferase